MSVGNNRAEGIFPPGQDEIAASSPADAAGNGIMPPDSGSTPPQLTPIDIENGNGESNTNAANVEPARVYLTGWRLYSLTAA
jgi:hypothetical protein